MVNQLRADLGLDFALSQHTQQDSDQKKKERFAAVVLRINVGMRAMNIVDSNQNGMVYSLKDACLTIDHENNIDSTCLRVDVQGGKFHIAPLDNDDLTQNNSVMTAVQLSHITGEANDLDSVLGAVEYVLAHHYPTAVIDGRMQTVMHLCRHDYTAPAEPRSQSDRLEM
ncbi:MAG: hypothetical protein CMH27_05460 [Micavibrio sp.]|nr:hypothetical protein [Micavibrio sp.]